MANLKNFFSRFLQKLLFLDIRGSENNFVSVGFDATYRRSQFQVFAVRFVHDVFRGNNRGIFLPADDVLHRQRQDARGKSHTR